MMDRGVASRYATALFRSALKGNVLDNVHEEAVSLKGLFEENQTFFNFLLSPQIRTEDKHEIIDATLKKRASDLFVRFLHLLVDKKRISFINEIADELHALYETHKGILMVRVTTAIPMDETIERKVKDKLHAETKKDIRIEAITDPGIIGGMILQMEDKIIDGSVRFRLQTLQKELDALSV
jgi:F-type H+-transporting ATPase subunit delta